MTEISDAKIPTSSLDTLLAMAVALSSGEATAEICLRILRTAYVMGACDASVSANTRLIQQLSAITGRGVK